MSTEQEKIFTVAEDTEDAQHRKDREDAQHRKGRKDRKEEKSE